MEKVIALTDIFTGMGLWSSLWSFSSGGPKTNQDWLHDVLPRMLSPSSVTSSAGASDIRPSLEVTLLHQQMCTGI